MRDQPVKMGRSGARQADDKNGIAHLFLRNCGVALAILHQFQTLDERAGDHSRRARPAGIVELRLTLQREDENVERFLERYVAKVRKIGGLSRPFHQPAAIQPVGHMHALSCFVVAGLFCRYQDCSAISAIMRVTSPEVTRDPPPPGLAPPTFSSGRVSTCVASARRAPTVDSARVRVANGSK